MYATSCALSIGPRRNRFDRRQISVRLVAAAALSASGLAGCTGLAEIDRAQEKAGEVRDDIAAQRAAETTQPYAKLHLSARPWLGLQAAPEATGDTLPAAWVADDAITLPVAGRLTDEILAARIEVATGMPVRFVGRAPVATRPGETGATAEFGAGLLDGWSPVGGIWTGSLRALMEAWTGPAGYRWSYSAADKAMEVVRRETVTFRLHALLGSQSYSAATSTTGAASGEGAGSQSGESLSTNVEFNPWREISAQLESLTQGADATVTTLQSAAAVVVTGSPRQIERIRDHLDYLNREVLRPVTLSAALYSVRVNREADYQIGITAMLERIMSGSSLQLAIGSDGIAVVKPTAAAAAQEDTFRGTLNALATAATTARVLSADVPSLNGKPAQFFELLKTAYLKEVKVETTDAGTSVQLTPGTIASGFSMSYVARITAPDEVLVRLYASLRDRPSFRLFTAGDSRIQLPSYADRAVQVTQRLRRGETAIVTGFRDQAANTAREGTFVPEVPLPEGRRAGSTIGIDQVLLLRAEIGPPLGLVATRSAPQ